MTHDAAIPLEDIFIDTASKKITTPIPCYSFQSLKRDPLEYALGYSRGEMDFLFATDKSLRITIRQDVFESLIKMHTWGILPSGDQIERILDFFESNYKAGVKNRVFYTEEFPTQPSYTYPLFFDAELVHLYLPDGRPCISGETLVTTTLHPCMAAILARDFLLFNKPSNLDEASKDNLRCIDCSLTSPLFLSWFQDCEKLTQSRPQTRVIYDCPLRMPTK